MSCLRRSVGVMMLCLNLVLTGCATPALWEAAEGRTTLDIRGGAVAVTGAFKSITGEEAYVCANVFDTKKNAEREMTLSIPLADRGKWKIRNGSEGDSGITRLPVVSDVVATAYVEFAPSLSEFMSGCTSTFQRLPVLQIAAEDISSASQPKSKKGVFELPKENTEAIYVVKQNGMTVSIGYVSAQPIIAGGYSIDVPMNRLPPSESKPYLYLFTPFTVVIDAVIGVAFLVVWAYADDAGNRYNQNAQPPQRTISGVTTAPGLSAPAK